MTLSSCKQCCWCSLLSQGSDCSVRAQLMVTPGVCSSFFPLFFPAVISFKIYQRIIHKKHFLKKIYYDLYFCQKDQDQRARTLQQLRRVKCSCLTAVKVSSSNPKLNLKSFCMEFAFILGCLLSGFLPHSRITLISGCKLTVGVNGFLSIISDLIKLSCDQLFCCFLHHLESYIGPVQSCSHISAVSCRHLFLNY